MKKLSQSKKEALIKRTDVIIGKIQELAWKMQEAGIPVGTRLQSAGRELRGIQEWINSQR